MQASLLLASGKPEAAKEAVNQFQALVKKSPENVIWRFNLGRALAAQGDSSSRAYDDRLGPNQSSNEQTPLCAQTKTRKRRLDERSGLFNGRIGRRPR